MDLSNHPDCLLVQYRRARTGFNIEGFFRFRLPLEWLRLQFRRGRALSHSCCRMRSLAVNTGNTDVGRQSNCEWSNLPFSPGKMQIRTINRLVGPVFVQAWDLGRRWKETVPIPAKLPGDYGLWEGEGQESVDKQALAEFY